ncbi:hypothetical protein RUM44_011388 [Polyplax serrata]|uniref:Uncharacterized protein n=1 Tax=Polyplax serrata TaxID=468196 RepID=A0ABR1ARD8_POLSC
MSNSPILFSSDDEEEGPELEELLLKKFQAMMQGVPPPSSITMSKLSASEMLDKYNEYWRNFGFDELMAKNFNSSKTSEEIANISQKVLSRYVYSETMSSCNIWFESSTTTNSAKKSLARRSSLGLSPGSRLSHLARRRQIFSSENLQKLANSERRRHIEIEKQNATKSRSSIMKSMVEIDKSNSFKRALFLSPEDENDGKQNSLYISSQPNLVYRSKSALGHDNWLPQQELTTSSSKKRRRLDSKERNGNWPRRALTFSEKDVGKSQDGNMTNAKVISEIQLNLHHKTKILWAVSVTLKEKNMHSTNPQFKPSASALFMICRKNLNKILNSKIEGGTSDKILHFAREHIDGILKKLGIVPETKANETIKTDNVGQMDLGSAVTSENGKVNAATNKSTICESQKGSDNQGIPTVKVATEVAASCSEKENFNAEEISLNLVS